MSERFRTIRVLLLGVMIGVAMMLAVVLGAGRAQPGPTPTPKPADTFLPIHIHGCDTPKCEDKKWLPDDVQPPPSRMGSFGRTVLSNMSINGGDGSNIQDSDTKITRLVGHKKIKMGKWLAFTIFENANDGNSAGERRVQTVYVKTPITSADRYRIVTCSETVARQHDPPLCQK